MEWGLLLLLAASCAAGFVQGVTGFGGSILLMIFLPGLYGVKMAPVISDLIVLTMLGLMAWRHRRAVRPLSMLWPTAIYLLASSWAIELARSAQNLAWLQMAFGSFLVGMAAYLMWLAPNLHLKQSLWVSLFCGAFSGVTGGLFGIGGPLMALYFLTVSRDREEYLANNCLCLVLTVLGNNVLRISGGMMTAALLLPVGVGTVASVAGWLWGEKAASRIDGAALKRSIYLLMAFGGAVTLIKAVVAL